MEQVEVDTLGDQEQCFVTQHLAVERAKPWPTRLADYWAHYHKHKHTDAATSDSRPSPGSPFADDSLDKHRRVRIGTEFHGFMYLPREIRDMVYSYGIITGSRFLISNVHVRDWKYYVFVSWGDTPYQRFHNFRGLRGRGPPGFRSKYNEPPALGRMTLLMGVSCTIHAEVAQLFFSRNQLLFPVAGDFNLPGFARPRSRRLPKNKYWLDYAAMARDVSYTFDMRDYEESDFENFHSEAFIWKRHVDTESFTREMAMRKLHDQKTELLEYEWVDRIDAIKSMTLDRLELDFEECYCSVGCCRKVGWVLDAFIHSDMPPGTLPDDIYCNTDWKTRPPLHVNVLGWRSPEEQTLMEKKLGQLRGKGTVRITYEGKT